MNHYDTLGVSQNASQKEIKTAYKKLIKKYHPDIYPGDKSFAKKKTQEINEAYDILSDEQSRSTYDLEQAPPEPVYNYTPPKYQNPESYSYKNYYTNPKTGEFDFENYKRYADYHRSKTPNSNYTTKKNFHDEFSNNILNSVGKMNSKTKILIILFILAVYLFFLVTTFFQLSSIFKGESSGTLLNTHKNNTKNEVIVTPPSNSTPEEEFNINDYYTEEELREVYDTYYSEYISSYSEFKKVISEYLYENYDF